MKLVALCFASLAACTVDMDPGAELESQAASNVTKPVTICDDWMCGTNSPVIDGLGFHELNIDRVEDSDGWTLGPLDPTDPNHLKRLPQMVYGSSAYSVVVFKGYIIATKVAGSADDPEVLTHRALLNASFVLGHGANIYLMTIEDVETETPFWAHYPSTYPSFETYELRWKKPGDPGHGTEVCPQPADDDILTMDVYHATVFEGERIHADTKTIEPTLNPRWFNFGCAGSTLAKLQLTGHTHAAELVTADATIPFSTTVAQRQTMLKMLSADYCGTGKPYTVGGQPLHWTDDQGTMTLGQLGVLSNSLEAEWTPEGASCLNRPRLLANAPSAWPPGLTAANLIANITTNCGGALPPPCTGSPPGTHLWSYNPHAIIQP